MLISLKSRILFGILTIVTMTTFSYMYLIMVLTEKAFLVWQNDNSKNMIKTVTSYIETVYEGIQYNKNISLDKRKSELKNMINICNSVISGYYRKYSKGLLSENEAKKQAIEEIRNFRYDNGDWILLD